MRESTTQVAERARKVLDIIFQKDIDAQCKNPTSKNKIKIRSTFLFSFFFGTVISITAHEGFIHGVLKAIGRKEIPVPTGGKKILAQFS